MTSEEPIRRDRACAFQRNPEFKLVPDRSNSILSLLKRIAFKYQLVDQTLSRK